MRPVPSQNEVPATQVGCAYLALRLAWYVAGPFALVVLARLIARQGRFSSLDVAYWLTVAFTLGMWWLALSRFGGQRREGEADTTRRNWRRLALRLLLVAGLGWAFVHAGGRSLSS